MNKLTKSQLIEKIKKLPEELEAIKISSKKDSDMAACYYNKFQKLKDRHLKFKAYMRKLFKENLGRAIKLEAWQKEAVPLLEKLFHMVGPNYQELGVRALDLLKQAEETNVRTSR